MPRFVFLPTADRVARTASSTTFPIVPARRPGERRGHGARAPDEIQVLEVGKTSLPVDVPRFTGPGLESAGQEEPLLPQAEVLLTR
jgi:hypothetical protein